MHGSRVANGNIPPSRLVKLDTTTQGRVVVAAATTDPIYGISGRYTRYPPYGALDDGNHAIAGENCEVYINPETEVPLQVGGTVTAGDRLTATTGGKGVTTTNPQDETGIIALQNGVTDQVILVQIVGPQRL